MLNSLKTLRALPVAALMAATAMVCGGCEEEQRTYMPNVANPDLTPTMRTLDVTTIISDSGYTRYRITSPLWLMFDEGKDPRWTFPKGLDLLQYDLAFKPQASVRADSATYFTPRRLWRLDGNVVMVNTQRDTFLTQQLFWDQNRRELYSDSFIHIVRQDRIIEGYGFRSNENMTQYDVHRTQGIIPLDGDEMRQQHEAVAAQADSNATDEYYDEPARRPAPVRASQRNAFGFPTY